MKAKAMADLIKFLDVMLSPPGLLTMAGVFCLGAWFGVALLKMSSSEANE
ncbi:hypothetical protein [Rhizobium binxianense]|nr:hypothetical protein [Rhizobium sp. MJ37]MDC9835541.1 hypothetical protein [Rhizobium sp. MJ37]